MEIADHSSPVVVGWGERLPWFFVAGSALYMVLPTEPLFWVWWVLLGSTAVGIMLAIRNGKTFQILSALIGVSLLAGAGWGAWKAHRVMAPVLSHSGWYIVEGIVEKVQLRSNGVRVLLPEARVSGKPEEFGVRVFIPARFKAPVPGDYICMRAFLSPPPRPVHPQAFNMQRHAWFMGLGAVGYTSSHWQKVSKPDHKTIITVIERWRQKLQQKIFMALGRDDPRAGVVVALIVGEKGAIPFNIAEAYRGSGLAHMLAISGLHMSLLAALSYLIMRRGLSVLPGVALLYPIKKWAAGLALCLTAAYLILSGASVPTQRAFIMTAVALCAVMLERSPFSLRLVGFAAFIVVLIAPDAVTGASFQMSFAAVVGLVAVYQSISRQHWLRTSPSWLRVPIVYISGVAFTTLIAGTATAPVAMYHFGRIAVYSVVSNVLALPVLGVWVMPWGLISTVLLPFDCADFPLARMADGVGWINAVALEVSSWPGHVFAVPQMPGIGFIACVSGGLWLALSVGRMRVYGALVLIIGLTSPWWQSPPDVMIADTGTVVAGKGKEAYGFLSHGRSAFVRSVWKSSTGQQMRRGEGWHCDVLGCVFTSPHGWRVVRSESPMSLGSDCVNATVLIATYKLTAPQRLACSANFIMDQQDLEVSGAVTLWLAEDGTIKNFDSEERHQKNRLWTPHRRLQG